MYEYMQLLGENVTAATNTRPTTELLDKLYSMPPVPHQRTNLLAHPTCFTLFVKVHQ
jgi:hypothetical protein